MTRLKAQGGSVRRQKTDYPHRAAGLRDDGGPGCSFYSHVEPENQQRVQPDVEHSADDNRPHGNGRPALGVDKRVQSNRQLHKQRTRQIHAQVVAGIAYGVRRGSGKGQNGCHEEVGRGRCYYRKTHQQHGPVA